MISTDPRIHEIPEYMRSGLSRYVTRGVPPGHFLCAVIDNDLAEACNRADTTNRVLLHNYICFFFNWAPGDCWGFKGAAKAWIEKREKEGPLEHWENPWGESEESHYRHERVVITDVRPKPE